MMDIHNPQQFQKFVHDWPGLDPYLKSPSGKCTKVATYNMLLGDLVSSGTLECDYLDNLTTLRKRPLFGRPILVLLCLNHLDKETTLLIWPPLARPKSSSNINLPLHLSSPTFAVYGYDSNVSIPLLSATYWKEAAGVPPLQPLLPYFLLFVQSMRFCWDRLTSLPVLRKCCPSIAPTAEKV